ncbi:MAG: amidohydrolase, partial [Desulfobacteraceae bacterium]
MTGGAGAAMRVADEWKKRLYQLVEVHLPPALALYRRIHARPELSGEETATAALAAERLAAAGFEVAAGLGGHGVAGRLRNGTGPRLLIRGDMDALPVREETGLAYASTVTSCGPDGQALPVMHACGHDLHTVAVLGAAAILAELRATWAGELMVVCQPAEETVGGAKLMIADGLYERFGRPDWGIALHVRPELPTGSVGLRAGILSAGCRSLDVTIRGRGGHGAAPHKAVDPIVLAAQFVLAAQTVVSRETHPAEMVVVSIGSIHGGSKRNVIPESVELKLTIRGYKEAVIAAADAALRRHARGLASAAGLDENEMPVFHPAEPPFRPVVNDEPLTQTLSALFTDLLGAERVVRQEPSTGSEDFGDFSPAGAELPLCMFHLGCTAPERLARVETGEEKLGLLHTPRFAPDAEPT